MESTTYIALSRQMALRRELDITAHNVANMATPAFKAERMVFREYLVKQAGTKEEDLSFTQDIGLARDLRDGSMIETGNPFDLAIAGEGFFSVDTDDGVRYTRHGRFQLNNARELVTGDGYPLLAFNGARTIIPEGAGQIEIAEDGTISSPDGILGKVGIVTFEDVQDMERLPNSLYETDQNAELVARRRLRQGMLEQSNVQPIIELTRLIEIQREHQSVQNLINKEHDRQKEESDRSDRAADAELSDGEQP